MPGMDLELLSGADGMGDMGYGYRGAPHYGHQRPYHPAYAPHYGAQYRGYQPYAAPYSPPPWHPHHHHHHRFAQANPYGAMMGDMGHHGGPAPITWFNYLAGDGGDPGDGGPPVHHHHHAPPPQVWGGQVPLAMVQPQVPGVAQRGGRVQPLGFTPGTFDATSGTTLQVTATPQRPLRGGRLVGTYARIGTSATGLLILNSLFVGTDGQLLSSDGIGFDMLSPNSFGVGVNFSPASVGNQIVATIGISNLPTEDDSVPLSLGLWGLTVG